MTGLDDEEVWTDLASESALCCEWLCLDGASLLSATAAITVATPRMPKPTYHAVHGPGGSNFMTLVANHAKYIRPSAHAAIRRFFLAGDMTDVSLCSHLWTQY